MWFGRAVQRNSSDKKPGRTERKRQASRKRKALLDILERVSFIPKAH